MKKFIHLSVIVLLAACSSNDKKSANLKALEAEREKLKTEQSALAEKLAELDAKILAAGGTDVSALKSSLVNTQEVSSTTFNHYFEVQGTLEADRSVNLSVEMPGTVRKIYVQEGQHVSAGQTILELDKEVIDQNINTVKDQLELAKFVFEKQEKLWAQNIGSELQFRQAKTNYESLKNQLTQLQATRSKSIIIAPFSGVVDKITPKVGEMAAPGFPAVSIVNVDNLKVKARLSEGYVGKVKAGSNVVVNFPSIGKEFDARVTKIGSSIDVSSRTFEIAAAINGSGSRDLIPNLIAKVKIRDYSNADAIVVPSQSVLQDINGNAFVYVVKRGKELPTVKKHAVKIGLSYENKTEVLSGLTGGEEIVVEGVRSINDGDKISVASK